MGISFLTPLDGLFALAAAAPLAALLAFERRSGAVRRTLALPSPHRRRLVPVVAALALLPVLVATAAAQPVVVRQRLVTERADAQAFFVFDTSLSMQARAPGGPTRLARAKREALRLRATLGDVPVGIAAMTDRTLPVLMPTTDSVLFRRTLAQSVAVDSPPPSQEYRNRATTLQALLPIADSHFFSQKATHRLLVVFTDGEASALPSSFRFSGELSHLPSPILVHVWAPDERIFVHGRPDRRYVSDPTSIDSLQTFASLTRGRVFGEDEFGPLAATLHAAAGSASATTRIEAHARVPLAPWFVLGGILPLGFLLYRRNL
jgi:hypothetical protein